MPYFKYGALISKNCFQFFYHSTCGVHCIIQCTDAVACAGRTDKEKSFFSKKSRNGRMDWDLTMQVIPRVGCQSKMKSPNSEITEIGRRKGKNKKMKGLR